MSPAANLRVLVIAPDPLARAGLAALLAEQPGLNVVGQLAASGDSAASLEVFLPDILVWDLGWDAAAGLEQLAALPDEHPPILALLPDQAAAAAAWQGEQRALLLRDSDAATIAAALPAAAQGLTVLAPELAAILATTSSTTPATSSSLTPRELETLRLLAEGLPNKTIAARLGVSEHTVKFHVTAILGKLGAESRTEAVIRAARLGLIPL